MTNSLSYIHPDMINPPLDATTILLDPKDESKGTLADVITALQGAIRTKADLTNVGGVVVEAQLPPIGETTTITRSDAASMYGADLQAGDLCIRTDEGNSLYILLRRPGAIADNWQQIWSPNEGLTPGATSWLSLSDTPDTITPFLPVMGNSTGTGLTQGAIKTSEIINDSTSSGATLKEALEVIGNTTTVMVTQTSLTKALSSKADSSDLASKADQSDLTKLQTDLASKADSSDLASKADSSDLASKADSSDLASKADQSDLTKLQTDLASKADSSDLASKADQSDLEKLQTDLESKADSSDLASKADQSDLTKLQTDLASKADSSDLASKADQSDLEKLQTDLESKADSSDLASKADQSDLTKLQTDLASKADSSDLASKADQSDLEKQIKYHKHSYKSSDISNDSTLEGGTVKDVFDSMPRILGPYIKENSTGFVHHMRACHLWFVNYMSVGFCDDNISGEHYMESCNLVHLTVTGDTKLSVGFGGNARQSKSGGAISSSKTVWSRFMTVIIDNSAGHNVEFIEKHYYTILTPNGQKPIINGITVINLQLMRHHADETDWVIITRV